MCVETSLESEEGHSYGHRRKAKRAALVARLRKKLENDTVLAKVRLRTSKAWLSTRTGELLIHRTDAFVCNSSWIIWLESFNMAMVSNKQRRLDEYKAVCEADPLGYMNSGFYKELRSTLWTPDCKLPASWSHLGEIMRCESLYMMSIHTVIMGDES
jgi:hypothetical protein